eukprot:1068770-Prorocentrum_lima.AAC.1
MTSSLVGSEMCIRDRMPSLLPVEVGPAPVQAPRPGWNLQTDGLRSGTVSYTHLTLPTICSV